MKKICSKILCIYRNNTTFASLLKDKGIGEVAEWSIAAVLKTVVLQGTGGSNPSLSAELTGQKRTVRRQKPTNQ